MILPARHSGSCAGSELMMRQRTGTQSVSSVSTGETAGSGGLHGTQTLSRSEAHAWVLKD